MPARSAPTLPLPVTKALRRLGEDIRDARKRRRIPTMLMAQRAAISRTTLNRIEKGDPGVALGHYAAVLFVLNLHDKLSGIANLANDAAGRSLADEQLPQRIRLPVRKGA